jgi:hypothetical protein
MSILRLKLPTDPRWVNIVEKNISEILTDHAWCEQKAASNAITLITINSEFPDLVTDMLALAKEEIEHFDMVHEIIKKRGLQLGRERKDEYVGELAQYMKRSNTGSRVSGLVERLLFSAMIEAGAVSVSRCFLKISTIQNYRYSTAILWKAKPRITQRSFPMPGNTGTGLMLNNAGANGWSSKRLSSRGTVKAKPFTDSTKIYEKFMASESRFYR